MDIENAIRGVIGRKVRTVSRVFFVHKGVADITTGPIQVEWDGEQILLLDVDGDGDSIRIRQERWRDPFEGTVSTDPNARWIEEHGKWELFDVSREPTLGRIIGKKPVGGVVAARTVRGDLRFASTV